MDALALNTPILKLHLDSNFKEGINKSNPTLTSKELININQAKITAVK